MPESDLVPIDVDVLRTAIEGTLWRSVDVVEETGSTNADLVERAGHREDVTGAVLLAEHQSAGRGRHGRRWSAPPRSQIALSFAVDTLGVPPERWGWLPLLTGLAICDVVRERHGVEASVKWPNDVLVDNRKLAGVLAEVAAPFVVVGFGLNVGFSADQSPDPGAVSLAMLDRHFDRSELTGQLLQELSSRLTRWLSAEGVDNALADDYRSVSSTIGTRVRAILPGDSQLIGTATGIDDSGRLLIDDGNKTVTVSAGDITHLRPAD